MTILAFKGPITCYSKTFYSTQNPCVWLYITFGTPKNNLRYWDFRVDGRWHHCCRYSPVTFSFQTNSASTHFGVWKLRIHFTVSIDYCLMVLLDLQASNKNGQLPLCWSSNLWLCSLGVVRFSLHSPGLVLSAMLTCKCTPGRLKPGFHFGWRYINRGALPRRRVQFPPRPLLHHLSPSP